TEVKCAYCGRAVTIECKRAERPLSLPKVAVYVNRPTTAVPRFVWLAVLLPVLLPISIVFGPMIARHFKKYATSFPAECGVNDELEIVGKTFNGTGTLISGETNCKITIRDSRLTGDVVVKTTGNATITIQNSTLEGRDAALELGTNDKVRISNN